ncbi:hypothetical protein ACUR5C_00115 [Aliikangiella sp. IMCC44653]
MLSKLKTYIAKFDQLESRKRLFITFSFLIICVLLVDLFWLNKIRTQIKQSNQQITQLETQINELNLAQQALNQGVYAQRNDPKYRQLAAIDKEIAVVSKQLSERAYNLVKPQDMAPLLKSILESSTQLKLVSLKKLPPKALLTDKSQTKDESVQMYKHAMVMTFEGGFNATQNFIKQLEAMPQQVNFERLDYSVENYPKSLVTLEVSTVSMQRKWIGG